MIFHDNSCVWNWQAYFKSFNFKNISNVFEKIWIGQFKKLKFSDEEYEAVQVYRSDSKAGPDDKWFSSRLSPASFISSVGLITPEMIQPYPKKDRTTPKKTKKGKLPGT